MIQTTSLIWPKKFLGQLWTLFGSKKFFGVWGAPTNAFSTIRKFCCRGIFDEKSRFLQIFTNLGKVNSRFPRDTLQVMRAYGSKESRRTPKSIYTHQVHPFWGFKLSFFSVHKKATFWRKKILFVPHGCKYSFGARQIILAEELGARRWFYIPWIL